MSMNKDEAKKLIAQGESQEVELKESFPGREKAARAICAFANTKGGTLVLGAKKNGAPSGINDVAECQRKVSVAAQDIKSPPLITQERHEIDGKNVVFVIVHRASDTNFHTFQGVIYVRVGSTNQKLDGQTMFEYLRDRQILCFDEMPSDAKLDDIDPEKIERFLRKRNQAGYLETHSVKDFLVSSKLATESGNFRIKNSAVLFFAKNPMDFVPQAELKLVRFAGVEAVDIITHKLLQSDLLEQIESAIAFVRQNISRSFKFTPGSLAREDIYEYPEFVIRESIVNAVAHRDYFSRDAIQVNIFNDRMEITNPGAISSGLSLEKFGHRSVQRNPITYRILRDLGYVEGLGTGVPKMRNEMRKAGLKDPVFDFSGNFFTITLMNMKGTLKPVEGLQDLNQRQLKAIEYLKQNSTMKSDTYASINGISVPTAINDLRELIRFEFIKKVGSFRGAYYVLNEEKFK